MSQPATYAVAPSALADKAKVADDKDWDYWAQFVPHAVAFTKDRPGTDAERQAELAATLNTIETWMRKP
jgi:3-phenylpropionate/cinnamic acid dioxygenase small subunit